MRALRAIAIVALPVLVAVLTAPITFQGGSILPWNPQMIDLDVYRFAGELVLSGGDIYAPSDQLPFLYPPVAALLAVPLAALPQGLTQLGWLVLCVGCLLAILYRLGLTGWVLSLAGAGAVYFCEPVNQTLAYGQLGIVLVALVVLDLVPGPRVFPGRRLLPTGVLTGLATAIKLTPALFVIYLLLAGRRRAASGTAVTMAGLTVAAVLVLPGESLHYWSRLAHGDTGLGKSAVHLTNQSILGSWLRIVGVGAQQTMFGLLMAAIVAGVGAWAACRWHRRGKVGFAVTICGVAGLLASPVSWSHHFVWVVPLAVVLLDQELPRIVRIIGWVFVGWVTAAPFERLPRGGDVELTYNGWQYALASFTAALGIVFMAACLSGTYNEPPLESAMVTPDESALDAAHPRKHQPPMTRPTTAVPRPKTPVQPP
jgi:alpha-1,2-mannosyltransferase